MMAAVAEQAESIAPYERLERARACAAPSPTPPTRSPTACASPRASCASTRWSCRRCRGAPRAWSPRTARRCRSTRSRPGSETVRRCGLMWGVQAASMRRHETTEALIADAARRVVELGWCQPGSASGSPPGCPPAGPGRRASCRSRCSSSLATAVSRRRRPARRTRPPARPSSVTGSSPYIHSRAIRCQLARGAQLGEHGERQHLHAPPEEVLGAHVLVAHLAEVAWSAGRSFRSSPAWRSRASAATASSAVVYHQIASSMNAEQVRRGRRARGRAGSRTPPAARAAPGASPSATARCAASSSSTGSGSMRLNRPKSRNATRPSASSMKLPGCGSPENWRWRYRQPRKKRNTISPMRSRSACGRPLSSSKPTPADELADEHPLARERVDDVGDDDERVPAEDARQRALVLGLELVVELLDDPLPDLLGDRLHVQPGRHPLEQAHDHVQVLQVRPHRGRHARVLDLDRHLAPVLVERRAVDLPDRRGRDRLLVEVVEHLRDRLFEVLLDHLAHLLEGDRRAPRRAAWRARAGTPRGAPRARARRRGSDITCPSFIAAPFIVPSTATICLAVSSWRRASASSAASSPRVTFAARVPNCFTASLAASVATVAVRRTREVGIFSLCASFVRVTPECLGEPGDLASRRGRARPASPARCRPSRPASAPTPCAAVVVVAEQHERRGLAERGARLGALGVQAAPHADEGLAPTPARPSWARRGRGR